MKNPKFFYKIDGRGNPIPGTNVTAFKKPRTGLWRELENICCVEPEPEPEPCPDTNPPVLFQCIDSTFYMSMEDENGIVTEFYTGSPDNIDILWQIPRGVYIITIYSVAPGKPVYINGEQIGIGDGGDIVLVDYDTTSMTSFSYGCDENGEIEVTFIFNSNSASYTDDELSGKVQQTIYTEDGLTILAQSVLGGGASQTFTIPYVPMKYCVDVPVVFVKDDLGTYSPYQTGGNSPFGTIVFFDPNTAVETCDAGGSFPTPVYTVTIGDGGGN